MNKTCETVCRKTSFKYLAEHGRTICLNVFMWNVFNYQHSVTDYLFLQIAPSSCIRGGVDVTMIVDTIYGYSIVLILSDMFALDWTVCMRVSSITLHSKQTCRSDCLDKHTSYRPLLFLLLNQYAASCWITTNIQSFISRKLRVQ